MIHRLVAISIKEQRKLLPNMHDPNYKAVSLRSLTGMLFINEENFRTHQNTFSICKEYFMSVPVVIFGRKNFYLLRAINKKISIIQAAGLIEYWHSRSIDKRFSKPQVPVVDKILTLQHLSGCFILLTAGLFLAFVIFMIEIVFKIIRARNRVKFSPT